MESRARVAVEQHDVPSEVGGRMPELSPEQFAREKLAGFDFIDAQEFADALGQGDGSIDF